MTIPDGVNVTGAGIDKTRLAFSIRFGSHSSIGGPSPSAGLRIGNTGTSSNRGGAHDTVFQWVRFRGGSGGNSVLFLGSWDRYTSATWPLADGGSGNAYDPPTSRAGTSRFKDCEWERPQNSNAHYQAGGDGDCVSIWGNNLAGETRIHDVTFERCHFGVKNGAAGSEGYGSGRVAVIIQTVPHEYLYRPDRPSAYFIKDWSLFAQNNADFLFSECVFEQSFWCTANPCDHGRAWAVAHGYTVGNIPENIAPDVMYLKNVDFVGCTFKGSGLMTSTSSNPVRYEVGKNCDVTGCRIWLGNANDGVGDPPGCTNLTVSGNTQTAGFGPYTPSPYDP